MKTLLITLALAGITATAFGQQVNGSKTQVATKEYVKAQQDLAALTVQWQKEIVAKNNEVVALAMALNKDASTLTPEQRKQRQDEINSKRMEAVTLQEQCFGYYGDLYRKQKELRIRM